MAQLYLQMIIVPLLRHCACSICVVLLFEGKHAAGFVGCDSLQELSCSECVSYAEQEEDWLLTNGQPHDAQMPLGCTGLTALQSATLRCHSACDDPAPKL